MKNLHSYDERAAIMYDATMALNLMTGHGKSGGDWGVHGLGHILSLLYGTPHGASLSILFPAWMKHFKPQIGVQIAKLGKDLFGASDADTTIQLFEDFFKLIGSPVRLSEFGIGDEKIEQAIQLMIRNKVSGNTLMMKEADYKNILAFAK